MGAQDYDGGSAVGKGCACVASTADGGVPDGVEEYAGCVGRATARGAVRTSGSHAARGNISQGSMAVFSARCAGVGVDGISANWGSNHLGWYIRGGGVHFASGFVPVPVIF